MKIAFSVEKLKKIVRSRAFIIGAAAIAIYTLAGFFLTPVLIRHYLPKTIRENLHKEVELGKVRFNPYLFKLELNSFRMRETGGAPILAWERLFVDWELKSLFKWAWLFREIRLEAPAVHAVMDKAGGLNLANLGSPSPVEPKDQPQEGPPRLIFENIQILNGQLTFTDQRQSQAATVTLAPVDAGLSRLTTLPAQEGAVFLTATSTNDETLTWEGQVGLNPLTAKGRLSLQKLRNATLAAFAGERLRVAPPAGTLTVESDCTIDGSKAPTEVLFSNLSLLLNDLALALADAPQTPLLKLPDVRMHGARLDLTGRRIDLGTIAVKGGNTHLSVNEKGVLNLQRLTAPSPSRSTKAGPPAAAQKEGPAWDLKLGALEIDGFAALYEDQQHAPGFKGTVKAIKVRLAAEGRSGKTWSAQVKEAALHITDLQAGFADAEPAVRIGSVRLEKGAADLGKKQLKAARIAIEGGALEVERRIEGRINLASLFAPPPEAAAAKAPVAAEPEPAADKTPGFRFLVDRISLDGIQATVWDRMVRQDQPILHVETLSAVASQVDGRSPMPVELAVSIREGGQIKAAGTLDPAAGSLTAKIDVTALALPTFQPYIAAVAKVEVKSGTISTTGTLNHGLPAAGARTVYQGGVKVEHLQVFETDLEETVIGWELAATEQLNLRMHPNALEIGDLRLQDLSGKIIIEKDGSFNLANLFKGDGAGKSDRDEAKAVETSTPFAYRVRRVLVNDGRVTFADRRLWIPFDTRIHELRGNIAGISSVQDARSELRLRGRVDEFGTARAEGEINTANPKMFTNVKVAFRNLEMSSLTPYSGQFAGRKIDAGKLTVDLSYDIDNGQLKGDNKIVVEQLKLGEKVASPDALNLPLDLAVALLKDSKGVIDLGLPVQGDLNNPQFSFGALVGKTLVNVLKKIVTSPFRALGALIPGGDEATLDQVAFDPGRAKVPPPEKEKLLKLSEALRQRPQVKLVVQGRYHPEKDRQSLARRSLRKTVTLALGQSVPEDGPTPLDFSSSETRDVLEEMFEKRFGEEAMEAFEDEMKAARKAGRAADAGFYAKELFARLLAVESVPDERLVELARARAQAVTAELGVQGLPAERLGTREPAALEAEPITVALSMEARQ